MQGFATQNELNLTWALQAALSAGVTAACAGVAFTFRRPAMRALALAFVLVTLSSVVIWWALSASAAGLPPATTTLRLALAPPLTPVLAYFFFRQIIRILAGQTTEWLPSMLPMAIAGTAALIVTLGFSLVTAPYGPALLGIVGTGGAVGAALWLAEISRRTARGMGRRAQALVMLQWAFISLALRSVVSAAVATRTYATGDPPAFTLGMTVLQAFLLVASAVLMLSAVLDEERAQGAQQAEQLREAERAVAASQRLESLGRMAGAVAHDFNNLLTVISLSAQSAHERSPEVAEDDLAEIQASARRGQEMTRQLLAFARQAPQQVARFDANVQLSKMDGLLRRIVGRDVTLTLDHGGPPLVVEMDATQFDQIVMNLVVNGRDATPAGGSITVSLAAADGDGIADPVGGGLPSGSDSGVYVRLTVADTGTGIPASIRPHIFDPFFTTKGAGEGTGLGLATCDGIIRRAGGSITVAANTPRGTRFDILIPRVGAS